MANAEYGMAVGGDQDDGGAEVIWYRDLRAFLADDRFTKFVPEAAAPLAEQLNAAMRFALYFAILLAIIKRSVAPFFIVLVAAFLTWGMYESRSAELRDTSERFERMGVAQSRRGLGGPAELCTKPSLDNPFMNVLSSDPVVKPTRPRACDATRPDVAKQMERFFAHNLYRDADDPFDRRTSSRQFYTMPVTTIPGDQTAFAKWLYGTGPTCKEGNGGRCSIAIHNRVNLR
jgi:Family of unknown function (DUF5762)